MNNLNSHAIPCFENINGELRKFHNMAYGKEKGMTLARRTLLKNHTVAHHLQAL